MNYARLFFLASIGWSKLRAPRGVDGGHEHLAMKGPLILAAVFLCAVPAFGTPTVVQVKRCPTSGPPSGTNGALLHGVYTCPLPNATLASNLIVVHTIWGNSGTAPTTTVSDNNSNTYTQAVTGTTNNCIQRIYYLAGAGAGITQITLSFASNTTQVGEVSVIVEEWSGIATSSPLDVASCNKANSATISSGSMTITTANDWVVQHVFGEPNNLGGGPLHNTSFTAGSQSNITWAFLTTDLYESAAVQWGVFTSTGAFNPTFTQGTSANWDSCAAAFKAAAAGTPPSGVRIQAVSDVNVFSGTSSPVTVQVPLSGNLFVVSNLSVPGSRISSISSTPSCTWSNTGAAISNSGGESIIFYAAGCTGSNTMTLSLTLAASSSSNDTYMVYDVISPNSWTFDVDSGGQTGTQSILGNLTTCTACLTPTTSTGIAFFNYGEFNCTSSGLASPVAGQLTDNVWYTGTTLDGPSSTDENNGWSHLQYSSHPGAITTTYAETCPSGNTPQNWAGRGASFKTTSSATPAPPTQLSAIPH